MGAEVVGEVVENRPTAAVRAKHFLARCAQESVQAADLLRNERLRGPGYVLFATASPKLVDHARSDHAIPRQRGGLILGRILGTVDRRQTRVDRVRVKN